MTHPVYSETFLDHFQNPRNVGVLDDPAITVEVSNPVCGDILKLSAEFTEGVVTAAAYKARGCTASIAAGSALTVWMIGKPAAELSRVRPETIEAAVGGLIPESKHVSLLCVDAVKQLLAVAPR